MTVLLPSLCEDLAAAAERQAARGHTVRRRARTGTIAGAGVLALGGVAATAATIWSPQLGDARRGHPTASASAPPADQLAVLGVLRRPATAADQGPATANALRFFDPSVQGIRSDYVRLLGTQPDGRAYVLVPAKAYLSPDGGPTRADVLCLFAQDSDGGGIGCFTTAQVRAGEALGMSERLIDIGTPVPAGPHALGVRTIVAPGAQMYGLVPDGVRTVRISDAGGTLTVPVSANFFQATLPRAIAAAGQPTVTW
jgi:hypothetical protein